MRKKHSEVKMVVRTNPVARIPIKESHPKK